MPLAEGLEEEGGGAGNLKETSRLRVIPLISQEGPRWREKAIESQAIGNDQNVSQILHHDPTTPIRVYLL